MRNMSDLRVLVVDDSSPMRTLLRTVLFGLGFKSVLEADDGPAALEIIQNKIVDIMLLDYAMPVLNGLEVLRLVRNAKDSPNRNLPIIMVTGHATRHVAQEAMAAGANAFLVKPLTARALAQKISLIFEARV